MTIPKRLDAQPKVDWVELPFKEAIRYLRGLRPTPKDVFDTYKIEARSTAFTATRVYKMEVLQRMLDQLQTVIEDGGTIKDFVEQFTDKLDEEGNVIEFRSGLSGNHLETIFRTNVQSAYGRGSWDQLTDSDIAGAIWGWRYHTVGDERVRDEHAELDGKEFELGQGDTVYPPWDFNCRCSSEAVTKFEAERDGLTSSEFPESVQAALQSTQFASPALAVPYKPDLSGYDLGLISQYVSDQEGLQP